MKKALVLAIAAVLASSSVWAASTASYDEMKKIKQAQREARQSGSQNGPAEPSKWEKFWQKESERSGIGANKTGVGDFFKNLNPAPFFKNQQEQYNARKASAGK